MQFTALERLVRAKVQLQLTYPFFSHLVMYCKVIENNNVPTIAVDLKGNIYFNSEWIMQRSDAELQGLLVHEALHLALMHLFRADNRDARVMNISADVVDNDVCVSEGLTLPEGGIIPNRHHLMKFPDGFEIEDVNQKTMEEIYDILFNKYKKEEDEQGDGEKDGDGQGNSKGKSKLDNLDDSRFDGHIRPDKDEKSTENKEGEITKEEAEKLMKEWQKRLSDADTYCRTRGLVPKSMERLIENALQNKVNWKHKLHKYITNALPFDYSYSRPNKRFHSTGIYTPRVLKENIEVVTATDTSASIMQEELSEFNGEIINIVKSFQNITMDYLVCDAEIQDVMNVSNGNVAKILALETLKGGGGTSHKPVVDWVNENKPNAKVLIVFTDGHSDIEECFGDLPPTCNPIIVICSNGVDEKRLEDYGDVIKL